MSQNITQRLELDFDAIDNQLQTWIRAGRTVEEIVKQSAEVWPTLPADYSLASIRLYDRMLQLEKPVPIQPYRDLSVIHRKRSKRIKKIEVKLEVENAPISLEALYRGLLRDQEAGCHKILALQRQTDLDRQQFEKTKAEREERLIQEALRQRPQQQETKESKSDQEPQQPPSQPFSNDHLKTLSLLLGFLLTLCLAGCKTQVPSPSTRLHSGSWLLTSGSSEITPNTSSKASWLRTFPATPPGCQTDPDPESGGSGRVPSPAYQVD